jgi:DNA-directed RNA polymerase subunit RPC12/RpoP
MKNVVLGAVVVVLLAVSAYLLTRPTSGRIRLRQSYPYVGVCLACKKELHGLYDRSEAEPFECPECRQRAVFAWWYCLDCQKRTLPELARDAEGIRRVPPQPFCNTCKCYDLTPYDPENLSQQPLGDNPLPAWP